MNKAIAILVAFITVLVFSVPINVQAEEASVKTGKQKAQEHLERMREFHNTHEITYDINTNVAGVKRVEVYNVKPQNTKQPVYTSECTEQLGYERQLYGELLDKYDELLDEDNQLFSDYSDLVDEHIQLLSYYSDLIDKYKVMANNYEKEKSNRAIAIADELIDMAEQQEVRIGNLLKIALQCENRLHSCKNNLYK